MRQAVSGIGLSLLALVLWLGATAMTHADDRPRLLVLTDIGGDPDDQQSMIRLLVHSNEFQIEGLIASASGTPGELKQAITQPHLIREIVAAYGKVQANLSLHAEGYPTAEALLERTTSGNRERGLKAIGAEHDTEGSQWIIQAADKDDARPLNICIWGGQTDLAQALWRVREDRGEEGLHKFVARLRVYDIADQDGIQPWIFENFPDLFYVLCKAAPGKDRRDAIFRGMYLGGDESLTSRQWLDEHVRKDHGPLGALYPNATWTAPNPHAALKEGDTPSWFYFLPIGMNDPAHPNWGSWGGRFEHVERGLWKDVVFTNKTDPRATVFRWRPAFQNELQARMDWCVQPRDQANHPPQVVIDGEMIRGPIQRPVKAGTRPVFDASGSRDPDGDQLSYRWFLYPEAGSYRGKVSYQSSQDPKVTFFVPPDAGGHTLHLILEVTDRGAPPLTRYARVVLKVE